MGTRHWPDDANDEVERLEKEVAQWKSAFEVEQKVADRETQQAFTYAGQIALLRAALIDTTYFLERHSNRWDGINGKHPNDVVESAREALTATEEKK
jgi:hypothetical protein